VSVRVLTNCTVSTIKKDARFLLLTSAGDFECESLVIATGGLSIPKMGATDFGYRIARQFAIRIIGTHPALVPLTFNGDEHRAFQALSGVSLEANVRCGGMSFHENILFTHRGLSGPAILQISSYWKPGEAIVVEPRSRPRRFVQMWRELYRDAPMDAWKLTPSGTEGYSKAEVTVGGVDTAELSSKTMEARNVHGLYFIGEVVDVTGHLGGFNFQWAWASGFVAGQYA
jgi:predicted flavoprotein YhiN